MEPPNKPQKKGFFKSMIGGIKSALGGGGGGDKNIRSRPPDDELTLQPKP